jgi:hypothetical protein
VKVAGKLGSREHEQLRASFIWPEVNPRRTMKKSELNNEKLFTYDYITVFALF